MPFMRSTLPPWVARKQLQEEVQRGGGDGRVSGKREGLDAIVVRLGSATTAGPSAASRLAAICSSASQRATSGILRAGS